MLFMARQSTYVDRLLTHPGVMRLFAFRCCAHFRCVVVLGTGTKRPGRRRDGPFKLDHSQIEVRANVRWRVCAIEQFECYSHVNQGLSHQPGTIATLT